MLWRDKMMKIRIKQASLKFVSYVTVFLSLGFLFQKSYIFYIIKTFDAHSIRIDACSHCNYQQRMSFVTAPQNVCATNNTTPKVNISPKIIITVCSKASNELRRKNIRATWGSREEQTRYNFRLVFLIGVDKSSNGNLEIEKTENGDIIQMSVLDTYKNLTWKTLHAFHWVVDFCSEAEYFFKVDDDVFINTSNLMVALKIYNLTNTLAGDCNFYSRPFRDKSHKWYMSTKLYPYQLYPPFCSGSGYIMKMETAEKIYSKMLTIPYFHLEDIFVALAVHKLQISVRSLPGFYSMKTWIKSLNCDCAVLRHYVDTDEANALWTGSNCKNQMLEQYPCAEYDNDVLLILTYFCILVLVIYLTVNYCNPITKWLSRTSLLRSEPYIPLNTSK